MFSLNVLFTVMHIEITNLKHVFTDVSDTAQ